MSSILTISHPSDIHADAVAWALEQRGHAMRLWNVSAFPAAQTIMLGVAPGGGVSAAFRSVGGSAEAVDCDVVWRRRVFTPLVSQELPEGDQKIALKESSALIDAALALAAPKAAWVNPPPAARSAVMKPLQLREAVRAGLRIPDTLCSNDPGEIRRFAARHRHRIIYKPFRPAIWRGEGAQYVAETTLLDADMLANDFALMAAPGIYQPVIDKQFELRVTVMGQVCLAAKLTLAGASMLPVDIKPVSLDLTAVEIELPEDIRRACLRLMASLGLVSGSMDLVVTPEGETLFLEVNESGQFLWIETLNPEIPMLSLFADFIASGRPDFTASARRDGVSWAAYTKSEHCSRFRSTDHSVDADRLASFVVREPKS